MIHYIYSKDCFTYGYPIQYKMLLFVYIYVDLLKLKAYKLFENSDADLSWLLFLKKPTCVIRHWEKLHTGLFFFHHNVLWSSTRIFEPSVSLTFTKRQIYKGPNLKHLQTTNVVLSKFT